MAEEIEELKRLSPEERIRKLKDIAEKNKKELEQVDKLMKESEDEIEEKISLQKKIPLPQMRSIDTSTLFGRGTQEETIIATQRFKSTPMPVTKAPEEIDLETIVSPAEQAEGEEERKLAHAEREYRVSLIRYAPAELTMERLQNISETFQYSKTMPEEREEMLREIYLIASATVHKITDIEDGRYNPAEEASRMLVISYKIAKDLLDKYKG